VPDLLVVELYGLEIDAFQLDQVAGEGPGAGPHFEQLREGVFAKRGYNFTGDILVPEEVLTKGFFQGVHAGGKITYI